MRTLEITVNIRKFTDDAIGYCVMEDTNPIEFEIEVSEDLSLRKILSLHCVTKWYIQETDLILVEMMW